jgi:predicted secreted protein
MPWVTAIVVYILVWWVALFAILPIGVVPETEGDPATGGWRGAPQRPNLGRKLVITTLVAAVIWGGIEAVVASDWMSFRTGYWSMQTK